MLVLPSDHLVKYNSMFISTLQDACAVAEQGDNLVTLGITPDYPETGYGYIKFNPAVKDTAAKRAYAVDGFVEKPSLQVAKEYLVSEQYLWNSGMFIWKVSSILDNFQKFMPDVYNGLRNIQSAIGSEEEQTVLQQEFENFISESIDYGVMEKAEQIYVIPGTFGWDDVGSWLAMERINKTNEFGNVLKGNIVTVHTNNTIIEGSDKLIATVGIEDTVIVDTPDALLVCAKEHAGEIKKVLENLRICNRTEYL